MPAVRSPLPFLSYKAKNMPLDSPPAIPSFSPGSFAHMHKKVRTTICEAKKYWLPFHLAQRAELLVGRFLFPFVPAARVGTLPTGSGFKATGDGSGTPFERVECIRQNVTASRTHLPRTADNRSPRGASEPLPPRCPAQGNVIVHEVYAGGNANDRIHSEIS